MKKRRTRKSNNPYAAIRRDLAEALAPPIKPYKAPEQLLTTTLSGNRMRDSRGILLPGTHKQILNSKGKQQTIRATDEPKKQRLSITSCLAKKLNMRREYLAFKSLGRGAGTRPHNNRFTVEC